MRVTAQPAQRTARIATVRNRKGAPAEGWVHRTRETESDRRDCNEPHPVKLYAKGFAFSQCFWGSSRNRVGEKRRATSPLPALGGGEREGQRRRKGGHEAGGPGDGDGASDRRSLGGRTAGEVGRACATRRRLPAWARGDLAGPSPDSTGSGRPVGLFFCNPDGNAAVEGFSSGRRRG